MKTISVQMSEVEYDTLGLSKDRFFFSEIADLIVRQMERHTTDVYIVEKSKTHNADVSTLPFSAGLWTDYDIDDRTLRSKAWGTHKRAAAI